MAQALDYTGTEHIVSTAEDTFMEPSHPGDSPLGTKSQYFANSHGTTKMAKEDSLPGYVNFVNNIMDNTVLCSPPPGKIKEPVKPTTSKYLTKFQKPEASKMTPSPRPKKTKLNADPDLVIHQNKPSQATTQNPMGLRVHPGESSKMASDILHEKDELRKDVYTPPPPPLQRSLIATPPRPKIRARTTARNRIPYSPLNSNTQVIRLPHSFSTANFVNLLFDDKLIDWNYEYDINTQKWCIDFALQK